MSTNVIPPSEPNRCVVCGAHVREGSPSVCWLCREEAEVIARKTPVGSLPASPDRPPPLPPMEPEHFSFTLGTLMLAVTLIAVLCGLSVTAPGLGIPLAILSVPTWIRASRALAVDPQTKDNPTLVDKVEKFFTSLGIVILTCLASCAAGITACTTVCIVGSEFFPGTRYLDGLFACGYFIGGCALVAIFFYFSIKFWPTRKWRR